MFCPSCGAKSANPQARFCMTCGQALPGGAVAPAAPPRRPLQVTIDHGPAYTVATVRLEAGQSIRAEAGAMVAMTAHVDVEGKMEGGVFGAIKRAVAAESFFQTTFTAQGAPGEVMLAPPAPGDISLVELEAGRWIVQSSSFLASDVGLKLDTQLAGFRGFFSGEGLFFLEVSGTGTLLLSSFGGIVKKTLAPNERYVVDTGHIVAFEAGTRYQLRKASRAGWWASIKSGEGVVAEYEGPGDILLQTRNIQALALSLWPYLPKPQPASGLLGS